MHRVRIAIIFIFGFSFILCQPVFAALGEQSGSGKQPITVNGDVVEFKSDGERLWPMAMLKSLCRIQN